MIKRFKFKNNPQTFFLPITDEHGEFAIIHEGTRIAHFLPTYKKYDIPKGDYTIIGKLSEIGDIKSQVIVDYNEDDLKLFKTSKEKLIHHLYYSDIRTKPMVELYKPRINYWGVSMKDIESYQKDLEDYNKELCESPSDYLIFIKNEKSISNNN